MPGILPMKVIKVGNTAQSRIAQACDRCRSKKIRCDGVRPTCSQCASVGFECRTSDQLSRRAFPRGYTESLEERVRQLEAEVAELKDLLDEKDEKLDMLSAMRGKHMRRSSVPSTSHTLPSPETTSSPKDSPASSSKEDSFRVQGSPLLFGVENSDSYFMGPSSGRSFIMSFKRKLQEMSQSFTDFNPEAFLHVQGCAPLNSGESVTASRPPPRIFSDRCVNVYFQEFAPLFPVLHKPSFLRIYDAFGSDPEKVKCRHELAQLYLIFAIAGIASENPDLPQVAVCEQQWNKAIQSLVLENTLSTLQCLILALLYCTLRADNKRVQHFKGLAVALSHRLGLHQSQKRFSFDVLTLETRKKVFWTLYTLDCFSSATLGLPKLLKEEDVQTEYPCDVDDEYIAENGFQPTLPGEYTRLSSALALFRLSRILARILEKNYPSVVNYELSLRRMSSLELELNAWYETLPTHLRLKFSQDKPSTDITSSRSPILALAFYHVRALIYRPAVGSSLGTKAAPALLSIADSSKHIIQITQLLEERNMSFAFCLNKYDLLALCGLTLLYQVAELKQDSKLTRDIERLVNAVIKTLNDAKAPGCVDLAHVARRLVVVDEGQCRRPASRLQKSLSSPRQRRPSKSCLEKMEHCRQQEHVHRMKVSDTTPGVELDSLPRQFFDSVEPEPSSTWPDSGMSVPRLENENQSPCSSRAMPNLDYLSLNNTPCHTEPSSPAGSRCVKTSATYTSPSAPMTSGHDSASKTAAIFPDEWEALLGSMDGGLNNVYDAIYGGSNLMHEASVQSRSVLPGWSPDVWDLHGGNEMGDLSQRTATAPQSLLGLSEERISPVEEGSASELRLNVGSAGLSKQPVQRAFEFDLEGVAL
ncbi:hypothetical protein E4U43_004057 [Claviceps pusilla]|uniref:Zn(2)-C6 fungal-type domain-containing protein n=1 Tax=Claviceps pusilla TaxID=123648 RepID=A0A9P7NF93_9HYPO|nr:hypothetical protein E4U43_004057 [Claviceps pusilla]